MLGMISPTRAPSAGEGRERPGGGTLILRVHLRQRPWDLGTSFYFILWFEVMILLLLGSACLRRPALLAPHQEA